MIIPRKFSDGRMITANRSGLNNMGSRRNIMTNNKSKNNLQICVCGWYYYPEFYKYLLAIKDKFNVVVIGNKNGDVLGLPFFLRDNAGLDWGAYSFFLDHHWDGKSNTLFIQDDAEVLASPPLHSP